MISTLTDVANYALNAINAGSIVSIDGTDKVSVICKKYIDLAFEQTIAMGKFTSCKTRAALTPGLNTPILGYSYSYNLPGKSPLQNGYVKAMKLESEADFEIEDNYLNTDDSAAVLIYLYRPYNIGHYQQIILDAVAMKLATMICMEIVPDQNRLILAQTRYKSALREAMAFNRSEKYGLHKRPVLWSEVGNSSGANQRVE